MQLTLPNQHLLQEATTFITTCYGELGHTEARIATRLAEIAAQIAQTGTYTHTIEELQHGAKMAWRNSNRCIGRFFWQTLHILDYRHVDTEEAMAEALFEHIAFATNGGKLRPAISIFAAEGVDGNSPRIWNSQLLRYAGYEQADGTVVGDPITKEFTKICETLGWQGRGGSFDLLPLVVQASRERAPRWFDIPADIVLEVPLRHPTNTAFAELQLKWYAVPMVSNMRLEIGGIQYKAAPFNGWYMGTEIGARNLADTNRYHLLPRVAQLFGLNTASEATLWRDQALVELNVAVLHSFKEDGVTIVDHHTAAKQFARFTDNETNEGRDVTGQWSWLIPPMSPAATHVFHRSFDATELSPNYFNQPDPYTV